MQAKWWRSGFFYMLLLVAIVALVFALVPKDRPEELSLAEFIDPAKKQVDTIGYWQEGEKVIGLN
ncbi:MAG: hypothetical protein IMY79_01140, partial [Chloroflexi bacterium]|nr:hypothetical protein [Chloroflexota bacterium]